MSAEVPMVEKRLRLSILVIESDAQNAADASIALASHDVTVAKTMMEVTNHVIEKKFDYILSDVRFPYAEGERPIAILSEILTIAFQTDAPVVFLAQGHEGVLSKGGQGVMLKACSISDVSATLMQSSRRKKSSEEELLKSLRFSRYEIISAQRKTPEVWKAALGLIMNVDANPDQMDKLIRKVKGNGLGVEMKDGAVHSKCTTKPKLKMR